MAKQTDIGFANPRTNDGPVKCLGLTFENDEARRAHFAEALRKKLEEPEFRATPGFPDATDEAILEMSDPPFYTACPNPFIEDFVRLHATAYDPDEAYDREPFSVDVSEGKRNQLYQAHGYLRLSTTYHEIIPEAQECETWKAGQGLPSTFQRPASPA